MTFRRAMTQTERGNALVACRRAACCLAIAMALHGTAHAADAAANGASAPVATTADAAVEASFDRSMLSAGGKNTDDLSRFERGNPVTPGNYNIDVYLNDGFVARRDVRFDAPQGSNSAIACVTPELLQQINLKLPADKDGKLPVIAKGDCVNLAAHIPGATVSFNQNDLRLDIGIPQAYMGQSARGYVSPEYWDAGVPAFLLNYNANSYRSTSNGSSFTSTYLGLNAALNVGLWHFRQNSSYNIVSGGGLGTRRHWDNIASFVQRDIPSWRAQLTIGDTFTSGEMFDSISLRGVQLGTDDRMLPESLRGYAPTVRGVAETNAKVVVRQNGIIIYQTTVTPGAFTINDLFATGYGGDLDVTVTEADGRVRSFSVPYASVAQLLRPGVTRFNIAAGEVRDNSLSHRPDVVQATVQRGFTNLLTGYAGVVGSQGYASALVGTAFNTRWGALAADITAARTQIPGMDSMSGQSLRLSYSKILPQTNTSLTVAAYRYSTSGFLGLQDALRARDFARRGMQVFATGPAVPRDALGNVIPGVLTPEQQQQLQSQLLNGQTSNQGVDQARNRFDLSLTQQLGESGGQLYTNLSTRDYWNRGSRDTQYQLGYTNHYKSVSYSLTATRLRDLLGRNETQFFASITLPLGSAAHAPNLTASVSRSSEGRTSQQAMLFGSAGEENQFSYGATASHDSDNSGTAGSVNLGYRSAYGQLNGSYGKGDNYSQASLGASGALVIHSGGVTFGQTTGDTVALVSAPDAAGARVSSSASVRVNGKGYALVPYLTPYTLNGIDLDPTGLPLNVQLDNTSTQVAPYGGAVVLVKFKTSSGRGAIIRARLSNGDAVPFGSEVVDAQDRSMGVVGQAGRMLVRGVQDQGELTVRWHDEDGNAKSCSFAYQLKPFKKGDQSYDTIETTCAAPASAQQAPRVP